MRRNPSDGRWDRRTVGRRALLAVFLSVSAAVRLFAQAATTIARIAPRNFELLASYATELSPAFALGISYKLVEFRVDCSGDCRQVPAGRGVTHALDIGGQFTVGPRGALRVGVAVRN